MDFSAPTSLHWYLGKHREKQSFESFSDQQASGVFLLQRDPLCPHTISALGPLAKAGRKFCQVDFRKTSSSLWKQWFWQVGISNRSLRSFWTSFICEYSFKSFPPDSHPYRRSRGGKQGGWITSRVWCLTAPQISKICPWAKKRNSDALGRFYVYFVLNQVAESSTHESSRVHNKDYKTAVIWS